MRKTNFRSVIDRVLDRISKDKDIHASIFFHEDGSINVSIYPITDDVEVEDELSEVRG
jgi:hypothetical protein